MEIKHSTLHKILLILGLAVGLLLLLFFTNPQHVPLPVLIMPFILIGLIIYHLTKLIIGKVAPAKTTLHTRWVPLSIAFMVIMLLLLESLHQLTVKDSLLIGGFTIALWVYLWRADFLHK